MDTEMIRTVIDTIVKERRNKLSQKSFKSIITKNTSVDNDTYPSVLDWLTAQGIVTVTDGTVDIIGSELETVANSFVIPIVTCDVCGWRSGNGIHESCVV